MSHSPPSIPKYKARWTTKDSPLPPKGGGLYTPYAFFDLVPHLGLNPTDTAIIQQLIRHKWDEHEHPFPSVEAIAKRIGASRATVVRSVSKLEKGKLLIRISKNGKPSSFNVEPLIELVTQYSKQKA